MKLKRIAFMRADGGQDGSKATVYIKDMLRYDVAFQSTVSPEYIAFPVFGTKDGNLGGNVTVGRWQSFGVRLRHLEPAAIEVLSKAARTKPEAWVTYRHPRNADGQLDYGKLVPVTLEEFWKAKDTHSI